jgi:hypothetical protein
MLLGSAVGRIVGTMVRPATGCAVGLLVGLRVRLRRDGFIVGTTLLIGRVGTGVGACVGACVGIGVGFRVGFRVGLRVGLRVYLTSWQHRTSFTSFPLKSFAIGFSTRCLGLGGLTMTLSGSMFQLSCGTGNGGAINPNSKGLLYHLTPLLSPPEQTTELFPNAPMGYVNNVLSVVPGGGTKNAPTNVQSGCLQRQGQVFQVSTP